MQYFGGKAKVAKPLAGFLNSVLKEGQPFVDLFCGSCNVISKIDDKRERVANDLHYELVAMHRAVQGGWLPPSSISETAYKDMRHNLVDYSPEIRGFAGFGCAFSGDWFKGYAKNARGDNFCKQGGSSLLKKHSTMKGVLFSQGPYNECALPAGALVYCDIPYKGTTRYSTGMFNHEEFYAWATEKVGEGYSVLVSEYEHNVPDGWEVVWRHDSKKGIRNKDGVQEGTVEVLMRPFAYVN